MRRIGLRAQAREETQDREQRDREDRRRGWRGGETVGNQRSERLQSKTDILERFAQDEGEYDDRRQKEDAGEDRGPDEAR